MMLRYSRLALIGALVVTVVSAWTPDEIAQRIIDRGDFDESRQPRQLPTEIQIQVTAPLFSSRLYDYGEDAGDNAIPKQVDVGIGMDLTYPLTFFEKNYDSIFILSNGGVGFESGARNYRANLFPGGKTIIAPFWNRNDMRKGGSVWYREMTEGRVLERGQSEIRYQYDKTVKCISAIVVTWENMQPLGSTTLPNENSNTFQLIIFVTDNGTFTNHIYSNIGWTQGAEAGFNKGDGSEYFALPTSGSGNIMYLEEYGNTGIPGEWMFEIDMATVARCKPGVKGDTCDESCDTSEWGYDCANCCHCVEGDSCDTSNGRCPGACSTCWTGSPFCNTREPNCRIRGAGCATNAISFTDTDRCGEPVQRCQCLNGYVGDGFLECRDVDECSATEAPCHVNAICINTPGNYFCQCKEGFAGDGVQECKAAFLYPTDGHVQLPKIKGANVGWELRKPMKVFGKMRDRIVINSNGIVAVSDVPKKPAGSPIEDLNVVGFAPFFAPIDVTSGGQVTVEESTLTEVLTRATQTIGQHFNTPGFVAKSVLIVTFDSVAGETNRTPRNTFQVNVIGGQNVLGDDITFLEILYEQLDWTEGAQASLIAEGNEIFELPGSGTEGVRQLTSLSNIEKPGMWLFRVDPVNLAACPRPTLQPPYCNEELAFVPPELLSSTTTTTTTTTTTPIPTTRRQNIITGIISNNEPDATAPPTTPAPAPATSVDNVTARRPNIIIPTFNNASRVAPGDRIAVPVFRTIIPNFVTPNQGPIVVQAASPTPGTPSTARLVPSTTTPASTPSRRTLAPLRPAPPAPSILSTISPIRTARTLAPISRTRAPPATTTLDSTDPSTSTSTVSSSTSPSSTSTEPRPSTTLKQNVPPFIATVPPVNRQPAPSFTRIDAQPDRETFPTPSREEDESTFAPIEVFTVKTQPTTRARLPTRAQPVIVTGTTRTTPIRGQQPANSNSNSNVPVNPIGGFDRSGRDDSSEASSKLAIIIPTAIVGAWLLLLLIIGLVVCCSRRNSRKTMRSKYDPTYNFRQMPGAHSQHSRVQQHPMAAQQGARGASKKQGGPPVHGSYEDHLEKAARLSNEMTQYNQQPHNARVSLYGSYWNVNGAGQGSDDGAPPWTRPHPADRQSGPGDRNSMSFLNSQQFQSYYDSCPEFNRQAQAYAYQGRY